MRPTLAIAVPLACMTLLLSAGPSSANLPTLITTWGSPGSEPGQFALPYGATNEGTAFIYVADQANNRVQKFRPDGSFVTQWGQAGSGPGDLNYPVCIELANGQLYVVEHQNHRVSRFTTDGVFLGSFGGPGPGIGKLSHPVGITSDALGNLYVVESTNHRVQKFSPTGTPLLAWGSLGSAPGQMYSPYGIEMGPDGLLYVGEYGGNRVQVFTTDGASVRTWGSSGTGPGQFRAAEGIAFDSNGDLYACDTGNDRVQKFTRRGRYLGEFAVPPGAAGERPIPSDITHDGAGRLYVVGFGSSQIYQYGFLNRPPDCGAASATVARSWPPNGRLVRVLIDGVTDPDGDPVSVRVTGITQDEPLVHDVGVDPDDEVDWLDPVHDPGGNIYELPLDEGEEEPDSANPALDQGGVRQRCPDGVIDAEGRARVRLERLPRRRGGNGRVYEITFEASDGQNTCTGTATVCVPLRRRNPTCGDDGQTVNSVGPCPSNPEIIEGPGAGLALQSIVPLGNRVRVQYALQAAAEVRVEVFDVTGRRIASLERAVREQGVHSVEWNAGRSSRGVYFCRLTSGAITRTRPFVVR